MSLALRFVLASASPRRLALLAQIGLVPHETRAPDIDESPQPGEIPRLYALRLAREKAGRARREGEIVLAADTVVSVGRRILPKTESQDEARACLVLLSGRAHRVTTAVCVIDGAGHERVRAVETRVTMKRLSSVDIEAYLASGEWRGKAGGYAVQGRAGAFVMRIVGSYSAVVGLPLYETAGLLGAAGVRAP